MYDGLLSAAEMDELLQNCSRVPSDKRKLISWNSDYNFLTIDLSSVNDWSPIMLIFPGICSTTRCLPDRDCPPALGILCFKYYIVSCCFGLLFVSFLFITYQLMLEREGKFVVLKINRKLYSLLAYFCWINSACFIW